MEIEVRVVRARVWLSSSLFLHQDGVLSLTRVGETEHVAHASIRSVEGVSGDLYPIADAARVKGQHKCVRSVTVAWEDQVSSSVTSYPRFCLPEARSTPVHGDKIIPKTSPLPRLDFELFLLRPRSYGGTSARLRPQTVYVGTSGWQLSEKDVEALVSSREVVFLTTLHDDLGTLEVILRCVSSNRTTDIETEAPTGFNINWSSSEALQKDLTEKARLKSEADKKLIVQLKQTALKAAKLLESRVYLVDHMHRSRAAARIQRRFRTLQSKKQENILKLLQEEEDRITAKKAQVRDKIIARNRQRALALRAQIQEHLDNNQRSLFTRHTKNQISILESRRMKEHVEAERANLKKKLAVLEVQRRKLTSKCNATTSNQHSRLEQSGKLFDNELVRAVQELHFTRPYCNQMSHM